MASADAGRATIASEVRVLPTHLRLLLEVLDEPAFIITATGEVLGANSPMGEHLGTRPQDLVGRRLEDLASWDDEPAPTLLSRAVAAGEPVFGRLVLSPLRGAPEPHRASVRLVEPKRRGKSAILCLRLHVAGHADPRPPIGEGAVERGPDTETRRLAWALSAYAASSAVLTRSGDVEKAMAGVCEAIVKQDPYVLALVGLVEAGPGLPVRQVASAGPAMDYLKGLTLSWAEDLEAGKGPTGRAIRSGAPHVMRDSELDPAYAPWRERGRRFGIRSSVTVPFKRGGVVLGALIVYAARPSAFGARELELFQRLGDELAFAITVAEERRRLHSSEAAREAAQLAIQQERNFSEAVIRSLPGILYLYDSNGRFLRWNERFETVTGWTGEEIARMHPRDFFTGEDRARVEAAIQRVFVEGEASVEARLLSQGGVSTPYYFTGVRVQIEDRTCLVGIGIDFTERERAEAARLQSEARYRALFEYAPDGIVIADPKGTYLDANPSLCRMLGYAREELIGKNGVAVVAPSELEHIGPALEHIRVGVDYQREWLFRRKDGSLLAADVIGTAMPDGNLVAVIRDQTERKAAEAALAEAEEKARDTRAELARIARVSTLGELAATIAHEINQPLAAISTNSDAAMRWLDKSPPNLDETRQALRRITRDSARAHDVIKRTRAFLARGDQEHRPVDLNPLVDELILMTRHEQRITKVQVRRLLTPELPPVLADRTQMQQVILNLILNGIDALRPVEGRERVITIRTYRSGAQAVGLSVEDTGVGLPAQNAEMLFEHFFTTKADGTGLGLAISRSIVEAHGGRLWAEPGEPYGARVQFTLPVASYAISADPEQTS